MQSVAAFFDDSGMFRPEDSGDFACLGMIVIPSENIRKCGDAWWDMLETHFQCSSGSLQTIGIEAKSSELCDMLYKLKRQTKLQNNQQKMFDYGLNTAEKVSELIEAIYNFLENPPVKAKYLAVIDNKKEVWEEFRHSYINEWKILRQLSPRESKRKIKEMSKVLSAFLVKNTYEFLLQRINYLSTDGDFDFSDALIIGDETADTSIMLKTQAEIQAGLGMHFSKLQTIVNRPWFGSSLHDPCLQIADWIAFTIRIWAEENTAYSYRIKQLLSNFRGYPDRILGSGIVLCPNRDSFPKLSQ